MHAKALVTIAIATLLVQVYAEPSEPSVHIAFADARQPAGVDRLVARKTPDAEMDEQVSEKDEQVSEKDEQVSEKAKKPKNTNGGPEVNEEEENEEEEQPEVTGQLTVQDLEEAIAAKGEQRKASFKPASAKVDKEKVDDLEKTEKKKKVKELDNEAEVDADAEDAEAEEVEAAGGSGGSVSPSAADEERVNDNDEAMAQDDEFNAASRSSVSSMSSASYGGASSSLSLAFSASSTPVLSATGAATHNNARATAKVQNAKSSGNMVQVGMGATLGATLVVAAYSLF